MELRVPGSAGLLSILAIDASDLARTPGGDDAIADVTAAQLDQAIDAMVQGHIEYVALHHGPTFLQTAGDGDGPYELELHHHGVDGFDHVRGGVNADAMRAALHGFRSQDRAWSAPYPWSASDPSPPSSGRFFGRLFGRR